MRARGSGGRTSGAGSSTRPASSSTPRPARSSPTRRGDLRRRARVAQGGAQGAVRVPARSRRGVGRPRVRRGRHARAGGRRMTAATADPATVSTGDQRARALVAERDASALALGREAGDLVNDPDVLATTVHAGLARLADPEYHEGMQLRRPGPRARSLGVRQPLLTAVSRGLRRRCARTGRRPSSTSPSAAPRRDPGDPLARLRPPRADDPRASPSAPGSACGSRPPARRRLDHRRLARPRRGPRHPVRTLSLGGARAARLLAVALGAPPRRLHDRDHPVRRPPRGPRAGRRRPRPPRSSPT